MPPTIYSTMKSHSSISIISMLCMQQAQNSKSNYINIFIYIYINSKQLENETWNRFESALRTATVPSKLRLQHPARLQPNCFRHPPWQWTKQTPRQQESTGFNIRQSAEIENKRTLGETRKLAPAGFASVVPTRSISARQSVSQRNTPSPISVSGLRMLAEAHRLLWGDWKQPADHQQGHWLMNHLEPMNKCPTTCWRTGLSHVLSLSLSAPTPNPIPNQKNNTSQT